MAWGKFVQSEIGECLKMGRIQRGGNNGQYNREKAACDENTEAQRSGFKSTSEGVCQKEGKSVFL